MMPAVTLSGATAGQEEERFGGLEWRRKATAMPFG